LLKSKEEEGRLTVASTWSSFTSCLKDAERSDARFVPSPHMSDSDRQLYFSDYVIELQNAEDEKRRRIRDARRRAEKAQRDEFRDKLSELAKEGVITPQTRWRGIEDKVSSRYPNIYAPVQAQGREVARELFEDFAYDWKEEYGRDRATLIRVWETSGQRKVFSFDDKSNWEDFGKFLLDSSAGKPDLYGEIRRISNRENPVSGVKLLFNELRAETEATKKNGRGKKRGSVKAEESEDEGEIIEDGEVSEKGKAS
jgi:pre-mRNA-processing factor 40